MGSKDILNWYSPGKIEKPRCVEQLLRFTYPTVRWDRVSYHQGFPHIFKFMPWTKDKGAVTLPSLFSYKAIDTYFNDGQWNPCSCDGLGLIIHEGFHALQMKGLLNGYGIGAISLNTIRYLSCSVTQWLRGNDPYYDNAIEIEAYAFAGKSTSPFETCCAASKSLPCDCGCMPPSVDQAGWQLYQQTCPGSVRKSARVHFKNFWSSLPNCIIGLNKIADLAKAIFRLGCKSHLSPFLLWLPCALSLLLSGVVWLVYGIYFAIWFVVFFIAALVLEVVGLVLGFLTLIVAGISWLVEQIGGLFSSPSANIWFTFYDNTGWQIPDSRVDHGDFVRTSASPSLAVLGSHLYMAYRSGDSSEIWYNVFDGQHWLAQDIKISRNGRTLTSAGPSLAAFNGRLYMAYKSGDSSEIWYNVFDGQHWRDEDCKVSREGSVKTGAGPHICNYLARLYMVYRDDS